MNLSEVFAEIRINEVELNPEGTDSGREWVELYSNTEINLSGWILKNNDNQTINLTQNFNNYLTINLSGLWLDNSDEKVFLYNQSQLIFETIIFDDSADDNKTFQYCSGNWNFTYMTKGTSNNCSSSSTNSSTPTPSDSDPELSIDMNWDEEDIINGLEEFDIEVVAKNLDDEEDYDVKVWIEFEDNSTIISQTYDKNNTWISSDKYYNQFFENEINKTKSITLRIKKNYKTYQGDAIIKLRLRKTSSSTYNEEISDDIIILEKDEESDSEDVSENNEEEIEQTITTNNSQIKTIKLGSSLEMVNKTKLETNNPIVYESSNEKIKKYAIFGFTGLCLIITILALFNKLN